jgi:hypothetical protein
VAAASAAAAYRIGGFPSAAASAAAGCGGGKQHRLRFNLQWRALGIAKDSFLVERSVRLAARGISSDNQD